MEPITDSRTVGSAHRNKTGSTECKYDVQGQTEVQLLRQEVSLNAMSSSDWLPGNSCRAAGRCRAPPPRGDGGQVVHIWNTIDRSSASSTASGSFFKIRACDCNNPAVWIIDQLFYWPIQTQAGEKETSHTFTSTEEESHLHHDVFI